MKRKRLGKKVILFDERKKAFMKERKDELIRTQKDYLL